jgi:multidrug efflux pump subunit AcrB
MLRFRWPLVIVYLAVAIGLFGILLPRMGTDLFPDANAPLLRIRLRAPTGTRIEETERVVFRALDVIRRDVGPNDVEIISDFVGVVPSSFPLRLAYSSIVAKITRMDSPWLSRHEMGRRARRRSPRPENWT